MTRPQPRPAMPSMKRWVMSKTLLRLVLMTVSQVSRSIFRNDRSRVTPALLTRMSMPSKSFWMRAHMVSTSPRTDTSKA